MEAKIDLFCEKARQIDQHVGMVGNLTCHRDWYQDIQPIVEGKRCGVAGVGQERTDRNFGGVAGLRDFSS